MSIPRGTSAAAPRPSTGAPTATPSAAAAPKAPSGTGAPAPADDYHEPAWDRALPRATPVVFPRATPVGPPTGTSAVPAFDRPQAVVVMGPKPLPVQIVGGAPGSTRPAPATGPKPDPTRPLVGRVTDGFRMAGEMAGGAGRTASAVAQGSAVAAFSGAVATLTAGLSRLGPYGMAASAALQTVTVGVSAFRDAVSAFVSRAREIGGYDGRIAGANAAADVRRINSDIREAQRLGDKMAKLVDQQSKAEAIWDELLLVVKGPILELLSFGLETANKSLIGILEGVNEIIPGGSGTLRDLIKELKRIAAGDPGADIDKRIREFLDAPLGGFVAPAPAGAAGGGMPPLGMPGF